MIKLRSLLALLQGKAVVISKKADNKAEVMIGKELDKNFVISSLAGVVKTLAL